MINGTISARRQWRLSNLKRRTISVVLLLSLESSVAFLVSPTNAFAKPDDVCQTNPNLSVAEARQRVTTLQADLEKITAGQSDSQTDSSEKIVNLKRSLLVALVEENCAEQASQPPAPVIRGPQGKPMAIRVPLLYVTDRQRATSNIANVLHY